MSISLQPQAQSRFLFLDGLRGIAAFTVICEHMPAELIGGMIPSRHIGMCFFFLLSGFVMSHAYGDRLANGFSPWRMTKIRLIRLYPLYLAGFLLGLTVTVLYIYKGWWQGHSATDIGLTAAFNAFMLPAPPFYDPALYPLNPPAWSLVFEVMACTVYAFAARYLTNLRLVAIVALSFIGVVTTTFLPDRSWEWAGFWYGLYLVTYGFFGGVLLHRLYKAGKLLQLPAWLGVAVYVAAISVSDSHAYDAFGTTVLMPLMVVCFATAPISGVAARTCAMIGMLSYGIYLVHLPVWHIIELLLQKFHLEDLPNWVPVLMVAVGSALLAAFLDRFYDRPVRRWLMATLVKREPAKTPAPRKSTVASGATAAMLDESEVGAALAGGATVSSL